MMRFDLVANDEVVDLDEGVFSEKRQINKVSAIQNKVASKVV
jgi:hypothetical protein